MADGPYIEIAGMGWPTLRMWIRKLQVGVQVKRYNYGGASEPILEPQYARQWVCDCGARGAPLIERRRSKSGRDFRMRRKQLISNWASHAKKHLTTRQQAMTLYRTLQYENWTGYMGIPRDVPQSERPLVGSTLEEWANG